MLDFELIYFLGKNKSEKVQGKQFTSVEHKELEDNSQDIASSSKD